MALYARKGEKIVCVDGHHIGTFKRDVYTHEKVDPGAIKWKIAPPEMGADLPYCPACNAPFSTGALQLHFETGWR